MEYQEDNGTEIEQDAYAESPFLEPRDKAIFIITAILGALFIFATKWKGLEWVFVGKALWLISFLMCNVIFIKIANWLREIAAPDAFFSSGMKQTLQIKFFWAYGPQLIGSAIALFVGGFPTQMIFM